MSARAAGAPATDDLAGRMAGMARLCVTEAAGRGIDVRVRWEDVAALDRLCDGLDRPLRDRDRERWSKLCGALVGEVLVAELGGRWVHDAARDEAAVAVQRIHVFPLSRAARRLDAADGAPLVAFLGSVAARLAPGGGPRAVGAGSLDELQVARAQRLVDVLAATGVRLGGGRAGLVALDAAVTGGGGAAAAPTPDLVAAYAGEVLVAAAGARWRRGEGGEPEVELPGGARVHLGRRAERMLRSPDAAGMDDLVSRALGDEPAQPPPAAGPAPAPGASAVADADRSGADPRATPSGPVHPPPQEEAVSSPLRDDGARPATAATRRLPGASVTRRRPPAASLAAGGRRAMPFGEDRPLGLRRGAFYDTDDAETDDFERVTFTPMLDDAPERLRGGGFGPSWFVLAMLFVAVGVVAWAIYLYRHAPP